jgi:hypothetical protein
MDDQRGSQRDEPGPKDPNEGVRIIGADEAAEAMERDDVAPRRTDDELRFGDRPPAPPAGPRPALRFPLDASADPTRIERPPVEPAPDPVTGPVSLPHWTDPPTGEVPAVVLGDDAPLLGEDEDDLDVWSSFATSTPRWRDADDDWGDDGFVEQLASESGEVRVGALGDQDAEPSHEEYFGFDDMEERVEERTGDAAATDPGPRWEVGDDDWSASSDAPVGDDDTWTEDDQWVEDGYEDGYDDRPAYASAGGGGGDRNMPMAIGVAVGLGVVGIAALALGSAATTILVTLILAACAVEYFEVLRKVGWESARLIGLVAVVGLPLAVHWRGLGAFPLVAFLAVATILVWYVVGAGGRDPRVLEGTGATLLGVFWIGGLGSSATFMAAMPKGLSLLPTTSAGCSSARPWATGRSRRPARTRRSRASSAAWPAPSWSRSSSSAWPTWARGRGSGPASCSASVPPSPRRSATCASPCSSETSGSRTWAACCPATAGCSTGSTPCCSSCPPCCG